MSDGLHIEVTQRFLFDEMRNGAELVQDYSSPMQGLRPRDWWYLRRGEKRREVPSRIIRRLLFKKAITTEVQDGNTPKVWKLTQ